MRFSAAFVLLALLGVRAVYAADEDLTIEEMTEADLQAAIQSGELTPQTLPTEQLPSVGKFGASEGRELQADEGGGSKIGEIAEAGKTIWEIVKDNEPEYKSSLGEAASALPTGLKDVSSMGGWKPATRVWKVKMATPFLKLPIFELWLETQYMYGGNYSGKGQYLENVFVSPSHLHVTFPYKLDADAKVIGVLNMGTPEHPIAAIQMDLGFTISYWAEVEHESRSYLIEGNGNFKLLGAP